MHIWIALYLSTDLLTIVYQCCFRFQKIVQLLLSADESFMKSAKSLWSHDFPGPITENFANMILVNCCFFMLVICFLEILLLFTDNSFRFYLLLYPESSLWCRWSGDRLLISVTDADLVDPGPDKTTQVVPGQVSLFANNRHQLSRF